MKVILDIGIFVISIFKMILQGFINFVDGLTMGQWLIITAIGIVGTLFGKTKHKRN